MSNPSPTPPGNRRRGLTIGVVVALVVAIAAAVYGAGQADGAVQAPLPLSADR